VGQVWVGGSKIYFTILNLQGSSSLFMFLELLVLIQPTNSKTMSFSSELSALIV
jgi:hypothetical protein